MAGTHLLIVVVVLCSGFIRSAPKVDQTDLLTVIPSMAIDALMNSGVKNPTPPAPTITPPTPTPPTPEPPQPVVTPPPKPVEPVTPPEKPDDWIPVKIPAKPVKPQEHTDDFTPTKRNEADNAVVQKAAQAAQRQRDQRAKAFAKAMAAISKNASSATEVDMPGNSSVSYANYGAIVTSIYHQAWIAPDNMASASAVVSFSVTIARDGSVISSRITQTSGESSVDRAVQRMLDRVSFIHQFPDDSKDRERTYNIDFNATRTSIQ
ncbi:MAG TPA: TonB family protein [Candidatus Sulfotelmatobacter sp.]|nr:TonB family protein [Candidatus Sulfotelmatobacter sp.]